MALSNEIIQNNLIEKFGDQVLNFSTASGILSFESSKEINLKILQYLYEEPSLGFSFLIITGAKIHNIINSFLYASSFFNHS